MSGTQPLPRLHIDQPNALSIDTPRADFGRVFDRRTRRVGHAEWNGQYGWIVFTPDQTQPHLPGWPHQPRVNDDVTLSFKADRFISLDHPDLYPLIGIAIQGDKLDAIVRARVVFDLGLAEAKSLIEAVLVERSERGPITGVTLKDGRTVVVRKQDDDEAKEREQKALAELTAVDDLRASDMDDAFRDIFRDATVVEGPAGFGISLHGTVYTPEVAEQIARQITGAQVTHASIGPVRAEGGHLAGVSLGYTVKRRTLRADRSAEFGDAFDALEQVLSNLGLGEDYQRVLLASLDKHHPEIHAAITVLRSKLVHDEDRTATSTP